MTVDTFVDKFFEMPQQSIVASQATFDDILRFSLAARAQTGSSDYTDVFPRKENVLTSTTPHVNVRNMMGGGSTKSPPDLVEVCDQQLVQMGLVLFDVLNVWKEGEISGYVTYETFMNYVRYLVMSVGLSSIYQDDWTNFTKSSLGLRVLQHREPTKFEFKPDLPRYAADAIQFFKVSPAAAFQREGTEVLAE